MVAPGRAGTREPQGRTSPLPSPAAPRPGWSAFCRLLGAGGVAFVLASAFTPFPSYLTRMMAVGDERPADAIVVLGGAGVTSTGMLSESSARRALHGIALHQRGLAPLLVFSAETLEETDARVRLAQALGISPHLILAMSGGDTTRGEAARSERVLRSRGIRKILLVTDPAHVPRARVLFERAGFDVLAAPADEVFDDAKPEGRLRLIFWLVSEAVARIHNNIVQALRRVEER